jgi:hypothetical protein
MTATPPELDDWAVRLVDALGLPSGTVVDVATVLDLARDAAHNVARPAAPLTTYLVGYAAGLAGGGEADVERAVRIAAELATGEAAP